MHLKFKKIILKIFAISFFAFLFYIVFLNYQNYYPKHNLNYYYKIMLNQEKVLDNEEITLFQLADLRACDLDFKCYLKYYKDYNDQHNLQNTFSNLSLLLKDYPEFIPYCHQITHGIGHSELAKNGGDLGKSLEEFSIGKYYNNISTCGSGYFHGLVEEAVKDITKKEDLIKYFKDTCNAKYVVDTAGSDCIHGLGHATFIQTNYRLDDSLEVCKSVADNEYELFNCYTGVFMEMNLTYPSKEIVYKDDLGNFVFKICDTYKDELTQTACYLESVLQFENFVPNKKATLKEKFGEMSKLCQSIPNEVNKLVCVKNIAIRSVIDTRYEDIKAMCLENTKTKAQRVFCVTNFAHRIAMSLYPKRVAGYYETSGEICKFLSISERQICLDLLTKSPQNIYFTSLKDLGI